MESTTGLVALKYGPGRKKSLIERSQPRDSIYFAGRESRKEKLENPWHGNEAFPPVSRRPEARPPRKAVCSSRELVSATLQRSNLAPFHPLHSSPIFGSRTHQPRGKSFVVSGTASISVTSSCAFRRSWTRPTCGRRRTWTWPGLMKGWARSTEPWITPGTGTSVLLSRKRVYDALLIGNFISPVHSLYNECDQCATAGLVHLTVGRVHLELAGFCKAWEAFQRAHKIAHSIQDPSLELQVSSNQIRCFYFVYFITRISWISGVRGPVGTLLQTTRRW